MGTAMNSLTGRMIVLVLAIYAVLLPVLFSGLYKIVEISQKEIFVNDVRKYSRFVADFIETEDIIDDRLEITRLLDSALLGSGGVYAELIDGVVHIQSELLSTGPVVEYQEDFAFGEHEDDTYFVSMTLNIPNRHALLRMGFDEQPTIQAIKLAQQQLIVALVAYLIVSLAAIVLVSARLTEPLRSLRKASRNIARGNHYDRLQVESNISEIKELTQDLETMRSTLVDMNMSLQEEIREREAAEAKRKLLETRLRQVDKIETVGVLAGGIAHEFNNILLPIFLYAEQAMHDLPPDSPIHKHLEQILKSAKRARTLVQQILTFSRQSGEQHLEPVDLRPVVAEAIDLLRALIPSTIDLRVALTTDDCTTLADKDQVHQLIINLGSNAYQAIGKDHGSITVSLERVSIDSEVAGDRPLLQPGTYIRLGVEDTGHGLEPGKIDRIFEPFYTTRAVGEGTGLGLSVAHGIVVSHKGDITVQSEPGHGTVFHVYLPAFDHAPNTANSPPAAQTHH